MVVNSQIKAVKDQKNTQVIMIQVLTGIPIGVKLIWIMHGCSLTLKNQQQLMVYAIWQDLVELATAQSKTLN